MNIESEIRSYIATNLLFSEEGFTHPDDVSFLREGIIDSLGVMELVTFASQRFGIAVEPHEVTPANFDSVQKLAAFVRRKREDPMSEPERGTPARRIIPGLIEVQPAGHRAPLFFLHGDILGGGLYCFNLARELGAAQPFYALPPRDLPGETIPPLEEIAAEQRRTIQAHTPHGPYRLGGFCIGAFVALEIALQLCEQGEAVEQLLIVDPQLPAFLGWLRSLIEFVSKRRQRRFGENIATFMKGYRRWFRICEIWRSGSVRKAPLARRSARAGEVAETGHAPDPHGHDLTAAYPWCAAKYRPRRYDGRAALFCCDHPMMSVRSKLRAWRKITPNGTVQVLPGEHLDLVTSNAMHLAAHLRDALERTDRIEVCAATEERGSCATDNSGHPRGLVFEPTALAPKTIPVSMRTAAGNTPPP